LLRNLIRRRGQNVPNILTNNQLAGQLTAAYFAANKRLTASSDVSSVNMTNQRSATQTLPSRQTTEQANLQFAANPLALAYQAARDQINAAVAPYLGEEALQRGLSNGLDVSPEATADRIADLSTRLFPAYVRQQPGVPSDELRDRFVDVIAGGIERGFNEARSILDGLKVLQGDIAANVDTTFELVMARLNAFREQRT
jgi:hypothetical protein